MFKKKYCHFTFIGTGDSVLASGALVPLNSWEDSKNILPQRAGDNLNKSIRLVNNNTAKNDL